VLFNKVQIFKTTQPRKFSYRPIYTKDEEEELEKEIRLKKIRQGIAKDTNKEVFSYKDKMVERWERMSMEESRMRSKSKIMSLLILLAFSAVMYFFL
jgi:hypothetical protein